MNCILIDSNTAKFSAQYYQIRAKIAKRKVDVDQ